MTNTIETKHTPTPDWTLDDYTDAPDAFGIYEGSLPNGGRLVCELLNCSRKDAEFIVRACNSHDALMEALGECTAHLARIYDSFHSLDAIGFSPLKKSLDKGRTALAAAGVQS